MDESPLKRHTPEKACWIWLTAEVAESMPSQSQLNMHGGVCDLKKGSKRTDGWMDGMNCPFLPPLSSLCFIPKLRLVASLFTDCGELFTVTCVYLLSVFLPRGAHMENWGEETMPKLCCLTWTRHRRVGMDIALFMHVSSSQWRSSFCSLNYFYTVNIT